MTIHSIGQTSIFCGIACAHVVCVVYRISCGIARPQEKIGSPAPGGCHKNIKYGSLEFAENTISDFSIKQCIIAATSLADTALDLIESEKLLKEVKTEFYETIK